MARLVLCLVALCAAGTFANQSNKVEKVDPEVLKERQVDILSLFSHIHEPLSIPKFQKIASTWTLEKNVEHFSNVTAAKTYSGMLKNNWYMPRAVPFSVNEPSHAFEAATLFYTLYSAKDYETFFNTAVYLRDMINEGLFVYVFSVAIIYRQDTEGIALPPIYDIFPSYFNNGEIMVTAQRINTHGKHYVEKYPSTFVQDDNVVIRWNTTAWPYFDENFPVSYFTADYDLNAIQYFFSLAGPFWLGSDVAPFIYSERRGESWWYGYRSLLARYYMERLSNDLGEIPDITDVVKDGYSSGLLYHNGIPFPSRPNNFRLDQPELIGELEDALEFERRIRDSIDKGFFINRKGEQVSLLNDKSINVLGNLIESNADSPNRYYYKDFIRVWKMILGNAIKPQRENSYSFATLAAPSALENYQTSLRDPAFYMIMKRVMKLFVSWQKQMPYHKPEDLTFSGVSIEKVEVDKLVTFFENSYLNVTNHLFATEAESKGLYDDVKVLVQRPRLNHKTFTIRVNVKSDAAKKVLVKFFLAPKYDSQGYEIPLHTNYENFFMLDQFTYDVTAGDNVITRLSTDYKYTVKSWPTGYEIYEKVQEGKWTPTSLKHFSPSIPHHLLLPKGKLGGMPFKLLVFIQDPSRSAPQAAAYSAGFTAIGYPTDRPLYPWQVKEVPNFWLQDVQIYHKSVPEVFVPHTY